MINENSHHSTPKRTAFRSGVVALEISFDVHGVRWVPSRLKPRLHTLAIILSPSRALPTRFEREPNFFLYKIELPLKVAPSIPELLNWRSGGLDFSILSLNKRGLNNRQATD
jgi:hypothetical protein